MSTLPFGREMLPRLQPQWVKLFGGNYGSVAMGSFTAFLGDVWLIGSGGCGWFLQV